jgi:hypothetical protein
MQLNQNEALGYGMHSTQEGVLHTIIRNCGPLYVHALPCGTRVERTFTAKEILLANGFPVLPRLANPQSSRDHRCTSFCAPSSRTDVRKRITMIQQSGNSMNVAVCCLLEIYVLLFVQRTDAMYD